MRKKLGDDSACLIIGTENDDVVAMALAQFARHQSGAGAIRPGVGHVSMVFVGPDRWGRAIDGGLFDALHLEMLARGWRTSSLWTGADNERAHRRYERRGYGATGDAELYQGKEIARYELQLGHHPPARVPSRGERTASSARADRR